MHECRISRSSFIFKNMEFIQFGPRVDLACSSLTTGPEYACESDVLLLLEPKFHPQLLSLSPWTRKEFFEPIHLRSPLMMGVYRWLWPVTDLMIKSMQFPNGNFKKQSVYKLAFLTLFIIYSLPGSPSAYRAHMYWRPGRSEQKAQ